MGTHDSTNTAKGADATMPSASQRNQGADKTAEAGRTALFSAGEIMDNKYELVRELGSGAGGQVFEARHRFTQARVAVKIVSPEASAAVVSELRARLLREARALVSARHQGIVEVFDAGVAEGHVPYIVMEMLEGRTLEGLVAARGRIELAQAVAVTLQLCDALEVAHSHGIVHRDIKPGNVFVIHDEKIGEHVKLVDFGVARVSDPNAPKISTPGSLLGTPEYMAPEQLLGMDDVDVRADIYGVGVTLFELLTGGLPFTGNYQQILLKSATTAAPPVRSLNPEIPEALAEVVDRAMRRDREARYQSAKELKDALLAAQPNASRTTRLLDSDRRVRPSAPDAVPVEQRRRHRRAPYATPVRILSDTQDIEGRNEDISEGGMLVISHERIEPGSSVTVKFALPTNGRITSGRAVVRWVRAARRDDPNSPRALGLEFEELTEDARKAIACYVELMADPGAE